MATTGITRFEIVWPQARAAAGYITFEGPADHPNRAGDLLVQLPPSGLKGDFHA